MLPLYVVSLVEVEQQKTHYLRDVARKLQSHRIKYHLFTEVGSKAERGVYTFDRNHHAPVKATIVPKGLRPCAMQVLGRRAEHLL